MLGSEITLVYEVLSIGIRRTYLLEVLSHTLLAEKVGQKCGEDTRVPHDGVFQYPGRL